MVFRRPELEKDNPTAPQSYLGPRRRRAQAGAGPEAEFTGTGGMREVLQTLTDAAARVVKRLRKTKATTKQLSELQDAIAQAKHVLSATDQAA